MVNLSVHRKVKVGIAVDGVSKSRYSWLKKTQRGVLVVFKRCHRQVVFAAKPTAGGHYWRYDGWKNPRDFGGILVNIWRVDPPVGL